MKISYELAAAVIEAGLHNASTEKINQLGGSVTCTDFAGHWFDLEWFHSSRGVATTRNLSAGAGFYIGASETNRISL